MEKISDFCTHMVDFRRPGHIFRILQLFTPNLNGLYYEMISMYIF